MADEPPADGRTPFARGRELEEVPYLIASFGNVRPWGIRVGSLGDVCPQPAMGVFAGAGGHQAGVIWDHDFRTKLSSNQAFAAEQHREASG